VILTKFKFWDPQFTCFTNFIYCTYRTGYENIEWGHSIRIVQRNGHDEALCHLFLNASKSNVGVLKHFMISVTAWGRWWRHLVLLHFEYTIRSKSWQVYRLWSPAAHVSHMSSLLAVLFICCRFWSVVESSSSRTCSVKLSFPCVLLNVHK